MSVFSTAELGYLRNVRQLGHLATVDPTGQPRVVPLGWRYNEELDTIDLTGRDPAEFVASRKFRDVQASGRVAFVVDDVLPPWRPRSLIIHGLAEAIDAPAMIRITPTRVISWGLDQADADDAPARS
ncbi:MAG TPA: PPOX class F420-dependent oxidoreductase [Jiangellaceae bacterium]|nr:PPOX class F420-dependent oxidoreductase [Jiangellaceae bacterium]